LKLQLEDWTQPGAYRVSSGVYRIPLPLPTDALRAVNVYAIEDATGLILVDGGWALTESQSQLERSLRDIGAELRDIRRFFVTHVHRDHYTQAVAIRRAQRCEVSLGEHERANLEDMIESRRRGSWRYSREAALRRAGAPNLARSMQEQMKAEKVEEFNELPDHWLVDGEVLVLDDRELTVIHTPGHTAGHVVFTDERSELLFAGDHVLPHITPSIGLEAQPAKMPLADYLTSLALVRELPDLRLLPAHGPVTSSAHQRVDELLRHHEERLSASSAALRDGASTAGEVAEMLPWTRRGRRLAELDLSNTAMAISETLAHLDVLVARGEATCWHDEEGVARFTRTSTTNHERG
jgi:glyoxylase-like metal-dependent hydrolase (beta-lactamase superfamily II)